MLQPTRNTNLIENKSIPILLTLLLFMKDWFLQQAFHSDAVSRRQICHSEPVQFDPPFVLSALHPIS